MSSPTLHMLCGKMASGKSTLAKELCKEPGTLLVSEDEWLSALYSDVMKTGADYVIYSAKLREIMGPHLSSVLKAGVSVVLDYPANTLETRAWMRGIFENTNAEHVLHFLDVSDDQCLERLHERNARGGHPFSVTAEHFKRFSKHFVEPTSSEGFNIKVYN